MNEHSEHSDSGSPPAPPSVATSKRKRAQSPLPRASRRIEAVRSRRLAKRWDQDNVLSQPLPEEISDEESERRRSVMLQLPEHHKEPFYNKPFQEMIESMVADMYPGMEITANAASAIQEATIDFAVKFFEDCNLVAIHEHRVTVLDRDLRDVWTMATEVLGRGNLSEKVAQERFLEILSSAIRKGTSSQEHKMHAYEGDYGTRRAYERLVRRLARNMVHTTRSLRNVDDDVAIVQDYLAEEEGGVDLEVRKGVRQFVLEGYRQGMEVKDRARQRMAYPDFYRDDTEEELERVAKRAKILEIGTTHSSEDSSDEEGGKTFSVLSGLASSDSFCYSVTDSDAVSVSDSDEGCASGSGAAQTQ